MLEEARKHSNIAVSGEPQPWVFDSAGNLAELGVWHHQRKQGSMTA
jgi:hypothetical protein